MCTQAPTLPTWHPSEALTQACIQRHPPSTTHMHTHKRTHTPMHVCRLVDRVLAVNPLGERFDEPLRCALTLLLSGKQVKCARPKSFSFSTWLSPSCVGFVMLSEFRSCVSPPCDCVSMAVWTRRLFRLRRTRLLVWDTWEIGWEECPRHVPWTHALLQTRFDIYTCMHTSYQCYFLRLPPLYPSQMRVPSLTPAPPIHSRQLYVHPRNHPRNHHDDIFIISMITTASRRYPPLGSAAGERAPRHADVEREKAPRGLGGTGTCRLLIAVCCLGIGCWMRMWMA